MSWIAQLYETYEKCSDKIGVTPITDQKAKRVVMPLMPVAHTKKQAQVEIAVNLYGDFRSAGVIDKAERATVIPCTEDSSTRTSKAEMPHPLHDSLEYIAGDLPDTIEKGKHEKYIEQLRGWCESPYSNPKVKAVLSYLEKDCVIKDMVDANLLSTDENGRVLLKPEGKDKPPIYSAANGDLIKAFVRFRVEAPDDTGRIWEDKEVQQSWQDYYFSTMETMEGKKELCYVQGKQIAVSEKSPRGIRNDGDGTKLISANDKDGFTFRGRFESADEALRIGYETTQKAHNALKWLINKQGILIGGDKNDATGPYVYVAWGTKDEYIPQIASDDSLFGEEEFKKLYDVRENYARKLREVMSGYYSDVSDSTAVAIMGVGAATKAGRLSIIYYREMNGTEFIDRVSLWNGTCAWPADISFASIRQEQEGKEQEEQEEQANKSDKKAVRVMKTPTPARIFEAAYGSNASDKHKKHTIERLAHCIVDCAPVPKDLVNSIVRRVSNPVAMKDGEYKNAMNTACAVVRKYLNDKINRGVRSAEHYKEEWKVTLEEQKKDRSYLFGRVWAYYHQLEQDALWKMGDERITNALRYKSKFCMRPAATADLIDKRIEPCIKRTGAFNSSKRKELTALIAMLGDMGGYTNEPLREQFLLGYMCQLNEFERARAERKRMSLMKKTLPKTIQINKGISNK